MGIDIRYEIHDENGMIGSVSGEELRHHFKMTRHDNVFNDELVKRFNEKKERIGSPDRMYAAMYKNGKRVGG